MIVTITDYASFSESPDHVLTIIGAEPEETEEETPERNPDPSLELGSTGWVDYSAVGVIDVYPGQATFTDCEPRDYLHAQGANATAFIAALADNTAYTVQVTVADYVSGNPRCVLKGGAAVDLTDIGGGVFEGTVTSGTSTAATQTKLTGNAASDFSARVTDWSVK